MLVRFFHLLISVFVAKQSHSVSAALPVCVCVWDRRSREEGREGGREGKERKREVR